MDNDEQLTDEQKLKEARRQRREARRQRKAAIAKAKAEQRERDEDLLDELEQKYGDEEVRPVWSDGGLVVIKRPRKASIDRWKELIARDGKPDARAARRRMAAETLALQCLLHPSKAEYEQLVERWPGIPTLVAAECLDFAQLTYEEEAEK